MPLRRGWSFWLVLLAWLVLLSSMLAGVIAMKEFGRRERAAAATYGAAKSSAYAQFYSRRQELEHLGGLYHDHCIEARGKETWSFDDVARAVPAVASASHYSYTTFGHRYENFSFKDPQTGFSCMMGFEDDRWHSYSGGGLAPLPVLPVPKIIQLGNTLRPWLLIRPRLLLAVGSAWLLLVVARVSFRRHDASVPLAHVALAVAVAFVGLADADPWMGLLSPSNHYVSVGLLGVLASLLLYVLARSGKTFRRRERLANRICLACGYDLRASPDRCPECGAVTAITTTIPADSSARG